MRVCLRRREEKGGRTSHLSAFELDLKVLGALLSHSATEIKLIHLAGFVPHGRFIVHHQLRIALDRLRLATDPCSSLLQL
jgi:hypothetical protein